MKVAGVTLLVAQAAIWLAIALADGESWLFLFAVVTSAAAGYGWLWPRVTGVALMLTTMVFAFSTWWLLLFAPDWPWLLALATLLYLAPFLAACLLFAGGRPRRPFDDPGDVAGKTARIEAMAVPKTRKPAA